MDTTYGICKVSIASVYKASTERSEMVTQVLYGEVVEILDVRQELTYIRCTWDDVTGWLLTAHLTFIDTDTAIDVLQNASYALSLTDTLLAPDAFIPVTLGANLPDFDGMRGKIGDFNYQYNGSSIKPGSFELKLPWIEKLALRYLHAPELYGGRSPFGIDSAALLQMVYKLMGIPIARYHAQQVTQGRSVDFMEFCQPGDLAFFDDGRGNIAHGGIILSDCTIIHQDGMVRRDRLDHFGIWNHEQKTYTWQLRVVKRHLPDFPDETMMSRMQARQDLEQTVPLQETLNQPGMFD